MGRKKVEAPSLAEFAWVSAERAGRELGVSLRVVYERIRIKPGAWRKVDGRWRIDVDALRRLLELEQAWYDRVHATHVAVAPVERAARENRVEPEWARLAAWLSGKEAARLLGLTEQRLGELGKSGRIERRRRPKRQRTGRQAGRGPRSVWVQWWYRTEDVARYWAVQERRSLRRALRGESFRHWGRRDRREGLSLAWQETIDTATAAEWLGVCRQHVARLCRAGKLPALQDRPGRCGSRLRIPAYAVWAMLDREERLYWREVHAMTADAVLEERGWGGRISSSEDAELREEAKARRREIGLKYGRESDRSYELRVNAWEPEEGSTREDGFGHRTWISPRWPNAAVDCSPVDREYGVREVGHGEFYSTSQVARLLGVKPARVRELRQQGRLQGYRRREKRSGAGAGRQWWFFRREEVEEFVAR